MSRKLLQLTLLIVVAFIFSCMDTGDDGSSTSESADKIASDFDAVPADRIASADYALPESNLTDKTHLPRLRSGIITAGGSGDLSGTVIDPRDNTPIPDVVITITLPDGSPAGIPPATSDSLGKFSFLQINDIDYLLTLEDPNFITTKVWTSVTDGSETTLPPIWFIPHPIIKKGTICGKIVDAVSGQAIPNAVIDFRAGINPPTTEPVLYTATTGPLGYYSVSNVDAGVYTGFASHAGYATGKFYVYALGAEEICDQNGALSPTINGDGMRIILQWGAYPADLDSHLWAPHNGCMPQNPFHLYYSTRGSHGCTMYFDLDLDDVTAYGPETTTIIDALNGQSPVIGQIYHFAVHDYTNRGSSYSVAMSNSQGLRVDVITAAGQQTFNMPTNTPATVWSVFDAVFDGVSWTITPLNVYSYQSNPALVY